MKCETNRRSIRRLGALRKHQLKTFLERLIASTFECGERGGLVEILFAFECAAAPDLSGLARKRPAADQVRFQLQLHEAWGFAAVGMLLQEKAHRRIVSGDAAVRAAEARRSE
jgi:hypothetical protein